jgi:hypothetical protein
MATVIENLFPDAAEPCPAPAAETWADFACRCDPEPAKPPRKPTDLDRVCLLLEDALGMTEEVADLSDQLRLRLYGQESPRVTPDDVPGGLAVLPRLMALAERLRDQTERTEANLADVSRIA